MNETGQTVIQALSWVVAPTGLVVTTVLLWENILKVRNAHLQIREGKLKIRQLEELLEKAEDRIYKPNSDEVREVLKEHRNYLRSERESIERLRDSGTLKPTRSVIISIILVALSSLPMLGVLSHVTNRANYAAAAASEQSTAVSSLESQIRRMDTNIRQLRRDLQLQRSTHRFILDWIEGDKRTEADGAIERKTNQRELKHLQDLLLESERQQ